MVRRGEWTSQLSSLSFFGDDPRFPNPRFRDPDTRIGPFMGSLDSDRSDADAKSD